MELVEVDVVRLEAAQAVFALLADAWQDLVGLRDDLLLFVHHIPKLRRQDHLLAPSCYRSTEDALAMTTAIVGCCVEKVDPGLERLVNGADRFGIVDPAPAHSCCASICFQPVPGSTNCPTAQTQGAHFQVTASQS